MDNVEKELSEYRLDQAKQCILSARLLKESGDYKGAANRAYYAFFHGMRAILALDKVDFFKHSGVSAYFRKTYIKTGIFNVEISDMIRLAFDIRSESDYDDFYIISKEEVEIQIKNAEIFINCVEQYLTERL